MHSFLMTFPQMSKVFKKSYKTKILQKYSASPFSYATTTDLIVFY